MTATDWREAIKHVKTVAQPASARQRDVATKLGIALPARIPERVAAVLISEALQQVLVEPPPELQPLPKRTTYAI